MVDFECPGCGKHMEAGFVWAARGLWWRKDGRFHFTGLGGEPVISGWRGSGTQASRCTACGLVLIATKTEVA